MEKIESLFLKLLFWDKTKITLKNESSTLKDKIKNLSLKVTFWEKSHISSLKFVY